MGKVVLMSRFLYFYEPCYIKMQQAQHEPKTLHILLNYSRRGTINPGGMGIRI